MEVILNSRWRVVDDPLQWILQVRRATARKNDTGYQNRSYCVSRTGLLRCIREYCDPSNEEDGPIDPEALAILEKLPELHK